MPDIVGQLVCPTMEMNGAVLRSMSLAPLASSLVFSVWKQKGFLDFEGRVGISSILRWSLQPAM